MSSKILGNVWDACAAHDIKGAKLVIMARLADYSNDDGVCYPSVETICRQLGLGESTVRTAIAELESAGWLRRESRRKGNRNTSNLYHLNADRLEALARIEKDKVAALKQQRRANSFHPSDSDPSKYEPSDSGCSNGFHPSDSDKNGVFTRQNLTPDPQVNSKHDPQVNSKHESQDIGVCGKASSQNRSSKENYSNEFEQAWQAYPKRSGGNNKLSAFKAWNARIKQGVKPETMLEGVKRYAAFMASEGKIGTSFVKQAATFFGPDKHFDEPWLVETQENKVPTRQDQSRYEWYAKSDDGSAEVFINQSAIDRMNRGGYRP
ncbi:helix-turn-helix domain-containing protein [Enterobacter hormaechei]|jgi:DNA-binding MarR family transcriptional regulator|uniref:helix-turn-helix domain-containing protein n=1 Tax=Enterobacter hormaechei TaxID=158836 RepID=UPI0011BA35C6|nr:helix-turn-helix domain-containing protein [Enterobacter hormaechei]HED3540258.1 helix-turn-helix domain-containing protein [Enterobacter hormaechei subsp. hormaechei]MDX7061897.1 helix-turn-helix domain-containing protein [Enterobacter hormaechei]TWX76241.1 helix-turn-helix domain-containing protein [Enterobacter hormaechei]HAS1523378.1 helix-turn-helix domain-containing protein [Enterobacter hormaechei]HAS1931499.1 helix-turn-helix domain-containing protein [Enterobacter hormaechei]